MVCAEIVLALRAGEDQISKMINVPRSFPHFRVADERTVNADHVVAADEELPPVLLDVIEELNSQRAIIKEPGIAPIEIAVGEDEPLLFAECGELFDGEFGRFGFYHSLFPHRAIYNYYALYLPIVKKPLNTHNVLNL